MHKALFSRFFLHPTSKYSQPIANNSEQLQKEDQLTEKTWE